MDFNSIKKNLDIIAAIITIIAGICTIIKDSHWYVYSTLFLIAGTIIIYRFFFRKSYNNFLVKEREVTIELLDVEGKEAIYTNQSRLEALKNNAQQFKYTYYGDGEIETVECTTGVINKIEKDAGQLHIDTSLPSPLSKGGTAKHIVSFKLKDFFLKSKESWEETQYTPGTNIQIKVIFPQGRICKEYKGVKKIGAKREKTNPQPTLSHINGKTCLIWNIKQVKLSETYRIEWTW